MLLRLVRIGIPIIAVALGATTFISAKTYAQRGSRGGPTIPTIIPQEDPDKTAYKTFDGTQDTQKKVTLGLQFIQKYPKSQYTGQVYRVLVNTFYVKQDWGDFYGTADEALARNPDDVDILTVVGWVIPHFYNENDPGEKAQLEKAEKYEKHAIELINTSPKPVEITEDRFAALKAEKLSRAHSGLGLVYFRTDDYENSVKELQQSTENMAAPDPTDLYALAVGLRQLNRYHEAADSFDKCALIPSMLQMRCQSLAEQAKTEALQPK